MQWRERKNMFRFMPSNADNVVFLVTFILQENYKIGNICLFSISFVFYLSLADDGMFLHDDPVDYFTAGWRG
jgi:hypothetical protein